MKRILSIILILIFLIPKVEAKEANSFTKDVASSLGWIESNDATNFCGGYFLEPKEIAAYPIPKDYRSVPTSIKAKKEALFAKYGSSVLSGDVTVSQPGRLFTANKVTIWRDSKTQKISNIDLLGDVKLQEYGKMILAKEGHFNTGQQTMELKDTLYRISSPNKKVPVNSWGNAKQIFRDASEVVTLKKTSYSTCPPTHSAWHILSKKLVLDKNKGRGVATDTTLYARNIPIFYFPYINFPIDDRRKSGFLYPTIAHSSQSGMAISWPYYFNLAPNYDLTLTPQALSDRGILTDLLFRYLTPHRKGDVHFGVIPYDKKFVDWRNSAPLKYPPQHALTRLLNSESSRGFFSFIEEDHLDPNWQANWYLNYVTDDYFERDFYNIQNVDIQDQLLNQASLAYDNEHWHFLGRLQAFQTLHPLTYPDTIDQYSRLPQLNLKAFYPNQFLGLNYTLQSQLTRFDHALDFNTYQPIVTGERLSITPSISWPKRTSSAYFIPQLDLNMSKYLLGDRKPWEPTSLSRILPIFSLDSGLFFQRRISLFNQSYNQTLEPRVYYLLVPFKNQNSFPIFDTTVPAFNFETLFRSNRFSGIDRIGDANQISLALTTRFLNDFGEEKINLSLAQLYRFHKYDVCLAEVCSSNDILIPNRFSPLVARLQYSLNNSLDLGFDTTWNPSERAINNASLMTHYHIDDNKVINLGYNFLKKGDFFKNQIKDLNRVDLSFAWPLSQHWRILGNWHYNASYIHPENYFYGLEYDGCCFATRIIYSQNFLGIDEKSNLQFEKQVFLQFLFKGLGAIGRGGTREAVNKITNYHDNFTTGFSL